MRHRFKGRRFGRSSSHRKAMLANIATALIKHEQITTTLPKAKDLRPLGEGEAQCRAGSVDGEDDHS